MNNVEKEFKRVHDRFVEFRMRSIWNGEQIRNFFTRNELIVHECLFEEVFYEWSERNVNRALLYIHDAYPSVTENDIHEVYNANADLITAVYG